MFRVAQNYAKYGFHWITTLLILIIGLGLFIALHNLRELGLRTQLVSKYGPVRYKSALAIGIVLSIILICIGKGQASFIQLWVPPFNLRSLTHLLMISSCILVIAGNLPFSYTRALTVHPMLVGVFVWGVSHLLSNGDLASVLLFGGIGLWSLVKFCSLERLNKTATGKTTPSLVWDAAAIVFGMIAYVLLLLFHGQLFGFAISTAL